MQVEYFVRFQEKCYDIGTMVLFYGYGDPRWTEPQLGMIEKFIGTTVFIKSCKDGTTYTYSTIIQSKFNKIIKEIVHPVYYKEQCVISNCYEPPEWKLETGWVWYILIIIIGTLFKARWLIYVCATAVFFLWKKGFLHK